MSCSLFLQSEQLYSSMDLSINFSVSKVSQIQNHEQVGWNSQALHVLTFFPFSFFSTSKTRLLKKIPKDDLVFLDFFLRYLFLEEDFIYVLFGDKAMGVSGYFNPHKADGFLVSQNILPWNLNVKKGAEIFRKYQHLFSMKNCEMLFVEKEDKTEILFINKKNFSRAFNKHQRDFQAILGPRISNKKLLRQMIDEKDVWISTLHEHEGLLGILLGYGKHNAWMFHRRNELHRALHQFSLSSTQLQPSMGFVSIEEELKTINDTLQLFANKQSSPLIFLRLPTFMADAEASETKKLKKKYIRQRKRIADIYNGNSNFLTTIIENLN